MVEGLGGGGDVAEDELGARWALGELFELRQEGLSYAAGTCVQLVSIGGERQLQSAGRSSRTDNANVNLLC